jgi:hypothetical protein
MFPALVSCGRESVYSEVLDSAFGEALAGKVHMTFQVVVHRHRKSRPRKALSSFSMKSYLQGHWASEDAFVPQKPPIPALSFRSRC